MEMKDIPAVVSVSDGPFVGTFTSARQKDSATWSWYPPNARRDTWPHLTVARSDNVEDTIPITGLDDSVGSLKKLWWYKLHVSVDISGRNLQMYYQIKADWSCRPCGNTMQHIPSHNRKTAQTHADRQATDYQQFAEAFIDAARQGWINGVNSRAPVLPPVGPQTARAFNNGDGL
jgi:hypothetical protein